MLKLKKIQSDASWGKVVDDINGNNGAIVTAVDMSKFANVDWGDEVAFPIVNAISSSATLQYNTCYLFGEVEKLNITLDSDETPLVKVYMFQFHSGATPTRLSVPSSVEWANDPIIRANRVYQVTIIDGYATYREFLFNTAEIPTTEIWYTSLDGNVVEPYSKTVFGAPYDSSTYGKSKGIMTFTGEVTNIGTDAFRGKTTLTSVTIPKSVVEIGAYAFYDCSSLHNVNIPNGVTSIGASAFRNTAIQQITLPDGAIFLGTHIFQKGSIDDGTLVSINIPLAVTEIPNATFQNQPLSDPKGIRIHSGITKIGSAAFANNKIPRVDIDDLSAWCKIDFASTSSVPVGRWVKTTIYINNESITSIVTPSDITDLRQYVFYCWAVLTDATITTNIASIGNQAFRYCTSLTNVTFESTTPPTLGTDVFTNTHASLQLRVPSSAVETYKDAYQDYASKIVGY